ncbi:hypothetical protein [Flavobacterium sp.]|uniref:hypothetical protein n=1 Tax=Flavobacterium sp. TaxID=239 RepID=UPI003F6A26EB
MKRLLLLLVLVFSLSTFGQNCKSYKEGKFKLEDNSNGITYIIERKGDIQTERIEGQNEVLDFKVKWLSDCKYMLTPSEKTMEKLKSDLTLYVTIKEIKGDFIELEMYLNDKPNEKMAVTVEVMN